MTKPLTRKTRLSLSDRLEIVRRVDRGEQQTALAQEFNVDRHTIAGIVKSMQDSTDEARQMALGAAASIMGSAIQASKQAAKSGRVDPHKLILGVAGLVHTDQGKPTVVIISQAPMAGLPTSTLSPPLALTQGEGVQEGSVIEAVSDNSDYVYQAKLLIDKE